MAIEPQFHLLPNLFLLPISFNTSIHWCPFQIIKDLCDNWVKPNRGKITMEFYDDYG